MNPFAELTNRTPSPSHKDEGAPGRKHSPWTAARHKKKTRSVQQQPQHHHQHQPGHQHPGQQQLLLEAAVPAFLQQQPTPESFDSPGRVVRSGCGNAAAAAAAAEHSLDGICLPGGGAAGAAGPGAAGGGLASPPQRQRPPSQSPSPHASPPVSKGSHQDADVHPCKAYIMDPQNASASPDNAARAQPRQQQHLQHAHAHQEVMMEAEGPGDAAGFTAAAVRCQEGGSGSPVWFRGATLQQEAEGDEEEEQEQGAAAMQLQGGARPLQHCGSAPATGGSNNLLERFWAAAHPQQHPQQQLQQLLLEHEQQHGRRHPQQQPPQQCDQQQQQQQQHGAAAGAAAGVAAPRRRSLVSARRRSWGGCELTARAPAAIEAGGSGLSRLSAQTSSIGGSGDGCGGRSGSILDPPACGGSTTSSWQQPLLPLPPLPPHQQQHHQQHHHYQHQQQQQPHVLNPSSTVLGGGWASSSSGSADPGFQLHSRLGGGNASSSSGGARPAWEQQTYSGVSSSGSSGGTGSNFLRRLAGWRDEADEEDDGGGSDAALARHRGGAGGGGWGRLQGCASASAAAAAAGGACRGTGLAGLWGAAGLVMSPGMQEGQQELEAGTLGWFEERLREAAGEGDLAAGQHLWWGLQASGLAPSRRFMHAFLMCCHYGGGDPVDAQHALREMCAAAGGLEPDSRCAQLLAAIDIGWQQLHCP